MASEKSFMNQTLVDVTALDETMAYRQNTGQAWQGKRLKKDPGEFVRVEPGMVILREARPISFGITGAGDITGVRKSVAFQIETKAVRGQQADQQINFSKAWRKAGGVYILAHAGENPVRKLLTSIP